MYQLQPTDILLAVLFIWLVALSFYLLKVIGHYRKLTRGITGVDLNRVVEDIIKRSNDSEENITKAQQELGAFRQKARSFLQKFALIRFNPFEEEGGDQSFVVALLNGNNDGVVISSLHTRNGVRVYAKEVENGQATKHKFTKEEKEAVEKSARQV